MISNDGYIKIFKENLEGLGYGRGSCHNIPCCVEEFLSYTEKTDITGICREDIVSYHAYIQQRPNKRRPGTLSEIMIHYHMYALKLFFNFLEQTSRIVSNPMSGLVFNQPHYQEREILTTEEIENLFKATNCHLERAVLSVFYGCGLRRSEGVNLDARDVHFKTRLLYVREGKYGQRRVVPMAAKVARDLKKYYLTERQVITDKEPFFINSIGNRFSGNDLNKILKNIILRAVDEGFISQQVLQRQISLHNLRHSIATHLLENGLSMPYVRDFLGHHSLEATQIYTRVTQKQLMAL